MGGRIKVKCTWSGSMLLIVGSKKRIVLALYKNMGQCSMEFKSSGFRVNWPSSWSLISVPLLCDFVRVSGILMHILRVLLVIVDRNLLDIQQSNMSAEKSNWFLAEWVWGHRTASFCWGAHSLSSVNPAWRWIKDNQHIYRNVSGLVKRFKIGQSSEENGAFCMTRLQVFVIL